MKHFKILSIVLFSIILLSSCGSKDSEVVVEDTSKEVSTIAFNGDNNHVDVIAIDGDESDFFEPVQGKYSLFDVDGSLQITIELVKTKKTNSTHLVADEFYFQAYEDEYTTLFIHNKDVKFTAEDRQDAVNELVTSSIGDKVDVTFSYIPADEETKQEIINKFKSCWFTLRLVIDESFDNNSSNDNTSWDADDDDDDDDSWGDDDDDDDGEEVASASSKTTSVKTASKGGNWDKVLNDYESYVNQYVALMKKAKNGDMSAMTEYAKMMEKAQSLASKLENASGEMTATQIARYTKITAKMAQAAY